MLDKTLIGLTATMLGCVPLTMGRGPTRSPHAQSSGSTPDVSHEPGMLELDTDRDGEGTWRLVIAAGAHTQDGVGSGQLARASLTRPGQPDEWKKLYAWKQFHDGITWIGGGRVRSESGELDRSSEGVGPAIPGAGKYKLKLEINGATTETDVEIVEVRQTSGEVGLGIAPSTYAGRASIRFDRDVHGIDIGYPHEPRLWITLPGAMTREDTRVDVLWYRGADFVGHSTQELHLGGIGVATAFERPTRSWTWPNSVSLEEMADGEYTVYVYQDGIYTTACKFGVAAHAIVARARSSAQLRCSKLDTSTDVKKRGAQLATNPEDPKRKAELLALYRSQEARDVLRELVSVRRSQSDAKMSRGIAVEDEENAWTRTQEKRAVARYEAANARSKSLGNDVARLERRYAALVAKHGRE